MGDYFFDTSGLVKRHVQESGSVWVRALVSAQAGHRIYIARIMAVEIYSAITRRQHSGSLSAAQAAAILGHFRRHFSQRYRVIEHTSGLFDDAMHTARKHCLRAYDAVQLAVALQLNQLRQNAGLGPVTLVSADRDLNAAAIAEGFLVEDPNTYP